MNRIVQFLIAIALLAIVAALLATSFGAGPLHGQVLMAHMVASGAMVFVLPLFAIFWLVRILDFEYPSPLVRAGYWTLLVTGSVTTATMFVSMLPIAGTDDLHRLIAIHGYAGFAMVAAAVLFSIGWIRARRKSAL